MSVNVSTEELDQVLQTIEMFEVITQANPHDCQSLEILREAYWKLGRQKEAISTTRRLADAYMALGQYSSAMLEYEGILQKEPNSPDVVAMLGEVEAKLNQPPASGQNGTATNNIDLDFTAVVGSNPGLIATHSTKKTEHPAAKKIKLDPADDGNEAFAKFLIQNKLVDEEAAKTALAFVQKTNKELKGDMLAASLLDQLQKVETVDFEALMCSVIDRTKFAYIPLDYYDVDRQIVKMLPESVTLGRLIMPFDLVSRTLMIATVNPFDAAGKEAVQQLFDYSVQWHLATPSAMFKILNDTYRLAAR
jgi:tetratricopeptide (TPR) repeat protein